MNLINLMIYLHFRLRNTFIEAFLVEWTLCLIPTININLLVICGNHLPALQLLFLALLELRCQPFKSARVGLFDVFNQIFESSDLHILLECNDRGRYVRP